ncbi:hypothetical protein PWT90_07626 [Aphanocladium album]|nr:hypothetical protein PWT90_07626 [Aphanocladium album]
MPDFLEVRDQNALFREMQRLKDKAEFHLRVASNAFTEENRTKLLEQVLGYCVEAMKLINGRPLLLWPREAAFQRFAEQAHRRLGRDAAADDAKKRAEEVEAQISERLAAGDSLGPR